MNKRRQQRAALTVIETVAAIGITALLMALALSGVQKVRASAARATCQNNMRQIALGVHAYQAAHGGKYPPGSSYQNGKSPLPFIGWQARLLPYLGHSALWSDAVSAYGRDKNFLHFPPHSGLRTPMAVFSCTLDNRCQTAQTLKNGTVAALSSYMGNAGQNSFRRDGVLYLDSETQAADLKDGASNTLMFGEGPTSADLILGWWYAGTGQNDDGDCDTTLGVRTKNIGRYGRDCKVGPYHFSPGEITNQCDTFHFWSLHDGGAGFAFCDGSIRFLRYDADAIMPALASRAGGEVADIP